MAKRIVTMVVTVRPARHNLQPYQPCGDFEQGQGTGAGGSVDAGLERIAPAAAQPLREVPVGAAGQRDAHHRAGPRSVGFLWTVAKELQSFAPPPPKMECDRAFSGSIMKKLSGA